MTSQANHSKRRRRRRSWPRTSPLGFSPFLRSLSPACPSKPRGFSRNFQATDSHASPIINSDKKVCNPRRGLPIERMSSPNDEAEDEDEEEDREIIQVDFEFFDPKPRDFHGVKFLLLSYLDNKPWDLSGFVDLILSQSNVGTVIKTVSDDQEGVDGEDEDESIYSVISVLNLQRYAEQPCIVQLKAYILEMCGDDITKSKLEKLMEEQANEVGILVSQRFVNTPNQLVRPLYDALFDEVSWATEDEPTQELRDSFRLKYYLLITRVYMSKHVNQRKPRNFADCGDPIIFVKAEDELFQELSMISFSFSLKAARLAPLELQTYREMGLVMVINADAVPQFREKLKALIVEP